MEKILHLRVPQPDDGKDAFQSLAALTTSGKL
jgi:hypothetical protein